MAAWKWVRTNATGTVRLSGQVRYMEERTSLFEFSRREKAVCGMRAALGSCLSRSRDRFFLPMSDLPQRNKKGSLMSEIKTKIEVSEKEEKLLRLIRELKFGELQVFIADGQPVRVEEVRKSIKL